MSNSAVGRSLVVSLKIVSNDPLGSETLLSESARSIDNNRFFLKYKSISYSWIVRIEAKVDTEAGNHARKDDIIHIFAIGEFNFDCVH